MRICSDCQLRKCDKGKHFCSECSQVRRDITMLKSAHTYYIKNRIALNERQREWNRKNLKSRAEWRAIARAK